MNDTTAFVELKGGLFAPWEALTILWALEDRGITCEIVGDKLRVKGPAGTKPQLSEAEIATIKARKPHLMALIAYEPPLML